MHCCANCFGDSFLDGYILTVSQHGGTVGACNYCGATQTALIRPAELQDYFQAVVSVYAEDAGATAKSLVEWFREDWQIFSTLDAVKAQALLGEILDDGEMVRKRYLPRAIPQLAAVDKWAEFRNEIMWKNRFFFRHELDLDSLKALFDNYLEADGSAFGNEIYRARIQPDEMVIPLTEMGCPPAQLSKNGRANPVGIPYLYAATTPETAIAETRPHPGDQLSVARFSVTEPLRLLNLQHPRKTISPFDVDESELATLRQDLAFLSHLESELSKPILPRVADLEYLPTQYLCEFIKNCGYDGVVFRSSISEGANVALFYDEKVCAEELRLYEVTKLHYEQKQKALA